MKKEIISQFKEKPKTKIGWRAMYLGVAVLFVPFWLGFFAAIVRPALDRYSGRDYIGQYFGFASVLLTLALTVAAFVTSIRAYKKGERSWIMWLGFVPAMLIVAFWAFMIAGEFLFPH